MNQYIAHTGVKGMKWGVRKQQKREYKNAKRDAKNRYKTARGSGMDNYRKARNKRNAEYDKSVKKWDPTGEKMDKLELIERQKTYNKSIIDADSKRRMSEVFAKESTSSIIARMNNRKLDDLEKEIAKGKPIIESIDKSLYLPKKKDYAVDKKTYLK